MEIDLPRPCNVFQEDDAFIVRDFVSTFDLDRRRPRKAKAGARVKDEAVEESVLGAKYREQLAQIVASSGGLEVVVFDPNMNPIVLAPFEQSITKTFLSARRRGAVGVRALCKLDSSLAIVQSARAPDLTIESRPAFAPTFES